MITLTVKAQPHVPLEAECVSPDVIAEVARDDVAALPVYLGKRKCRLDDFFEVDGEASDDIRIEGDVGKVKWIGRGMTRGRITVNGNAGMHLGSAMRGGTIEVSGNVADWVGAEMAGGLIRIRGNAGGQVGAAYRGSRAGMRGGTILVDGSAGLEVGMRMRRGLIALGGPARDFAGLQMKGGTIVLLAGAELRTGAWMTRGTIVSFKPLALLPTFASACAYRPTFLRLYVKHLAALGVSVPSDHGSYRHYTGDTSVPGQGEILVAQAGAA